MLKVAQFDPWDSFGLRSAFDTAGLSVSVVSSADFFDFLPEITWADDVDEADPSGPPGCT